MEFFLESIIVDGFKVNCIKNDSCITPFLKENKKMWEYFLEKYIKECYEENTNMIDIGANIGTFSLMMSKYISNNSYIYSFEPVYSQILNMNIDQNQLNNKIKMFNFGLSNKSEKLAAGFIDFSIDANYGYTRIDNLKLYMFF
jgi:hypothetical protein